MGGKEVVRRKKSEGTDKRRSLHYRKIDLTGSQGERGEEGTPTKEKRGLLILAKGT